MDARDCIVAEFQYTLLFVCIFVVFVVSEICHTLLRYEI